jgi:hypothetical protein
MVDPTRCSELDIDVILHEFLAIRFHFPMQYLELPLSVYPLRSTDFQFIVDKMAIKLPICQGNLSLLLVGRPSSSRWPLRKESYPLTDLDNVNLAALDKVFSGKVVTTAKGIMKAILNLETSFLWLLRINILVENTKLNRRWFADPKTWESLVFSTLRNSIAPWCEDVTPKTTAQFQNILPSWFDQRHHYKCN